MSQQFGRQLRQFRPPQGQMLQFGDMGQQVRGQFCLTGRDF